MATTLPRNIYEQQSHNKGMTLVVMAGFIFFLTFIGLGFDFFYLESLTEEMFFPIGTFIALAFGFGSSFWGLQSGAAAVLSSSGAQPANPANPDHRQLINTVEEMSIAAGMVMPNVFVIPDPDPNAFATGKDPHHSSIAVTQGLLTKLNREELQGVVAHEMSHIRNYDIRLMTIVAALMGAILLLSDWARRAMWYGGGSRRRKSSGGGSPLMLILLVFWIIGIILAPLISQLMAMAISRKREYLADASGAELTRNPLGLARALRKIEDAAEPTAAIKRGAAHLCIADPLGKKINLKEGFFAELFGTHPPTGKRILALQAMAYQYERSSTSA
ncbi:MAG: M48 family metalloprotease [bacterium]